MCKTHPHSKDYGGRVREHIYVMETYLGRPLNQEKGQRRTGNAEVVHHIDGDKLNNDLSNLQLMTVTAEMKAMIDRCQAMWARKYVLKQPPLGEKERKGLFIAVGGTKFAKLFEPAQATIKALFNTLNVTYAGELLFRGVDEKGAITRHPDALPQAFLAGQKLVED